MRRTLFTIVLLALATAAPAYKAPAVDPAQSKTYQVGCYYFPGWKYADQWMPLQKAGYPKPLLGYYREGAPEVADWHLKWAAEHGITFFIYDWYCQNGGRSLEHALLDGYLKAANRKYVKFCLLWANHNAPGTNSEKDLLDTCDYWIKNLFNRPEYFKVDGKPMIVFFFSYNIRKDLGGSVAVKQALDKMRKQAKAAGLPGIYFVVSQDFSADNAKTFKDEGWDAATTYNYPGAGAKDGDNAPSYESMVTGYEEIWKDIDAKFQIPYMVPTCPGWDIRPWQGKDGLHRTGQSPALFEDMCKRAKSFIDERPASRTPRIMITEAWNEFGEGAYIEPTEATGFGYLDAIRNVFTDADPKHKDVTPAMVGMSVPTVPSAFRQPEWEFSRGFDGWDTLCGVKRFEVKNGGLVVVSANSDPAIRTAIADLDAGKYSTLEVCMKDSDSSLAQLFFQKIGGNWNEGDSVGFSTTGDGKFHTYTVDLKANKNWSGTINAVRFDPNIKANATSVIRYIRIR